MCLLVLSCYKHVEEEEKKKKRKEEEKPKRPSPILSAQRDNVPSWVLHVVQTQQYSVSVDTSSWSKCADVGKATWCTIVINSVERSIMGPPCSHLIVLTVDGSYPWLHMHSEDYGKYNM